MSHSAIMRVEGQRRHTQPIARQDDKIVLDVVPDFGNGRVGQGAAQSIQHLLDGQLAGSIDVTQWDIVALPGFNRQGDAHQVGPHLVGGGGLGIEGDSRRAGQLAPPGRPELPVCR